MFYGKANYFQENDYVMDAYQEIQDISDGGSSTQIYNAGNRLNDIIRKAIRARTRSSDLTTILTDISNAIGMLRLNDEGSDSLIEQRISILYQAYEILNSSY